MSKLAQSVEAAVKGASKGKKSRKSKKADGKEGIVLAPKNEAPMTKEFVAQAERADAEIREDVVSINRDLTSLGAKFHSFQQHGYHRALNFANFDEWVDDVAQERGMKHSQIRLTMRIHRALVGVGEGKVAAKEVQKMTLQNANLLSGVPPKARTPRVFEAAQTMTEKDFQKDVILPIMKKAGKLHEVPKGKGIDVNYKGELKRIGPFTVDKEVAENFEYAMQIAEYYATDDDRKFPLTWKAIDAIAAEFISTHSAEYEEAIAKQPEASGQEGAQATA